MNESSGPNQLNSALPSSSSSSSPSPSPSPKWDSRRQSFISPTKLQEIRATTPLHNFTTTTTTMLAPSNDQAHPRPNLSQQQQHHTRTSSFFSFRGNKDKGGQQAAQQQQQQQPQPGDLPMQRAPSMEYSQPPASAPTLPPVTVTAPVPSSPPAPPPLHPEIRSIVGLTVSHAHKIYFSGPLIRRIERDPSGHKPSKDEGWVEIWAQLGGTTLSTWDMKAIAEASKNGKEVPPSYINMTDAFVQVLGSVTVPATPENPVAQKYTNVLTLNTAGSNLLLFACPDTKSLICWAAALRLSAWEKSRLEEIYTAHLIRITLSARDVPTTLVRNRLEGWVRIRIASQTDWKLVWMVVTGGSPGSGSAAGTPLGTDELGRVHSNSSATNPSQFPKKKRISSFFSGNKDSSNGNGIGHNVNVNVEPTLPCISFYLSPPPNSSHPSSLLTSTSNSKLRLKSKSSNSHPLLTLPIVSQVFAVYPERPELISRSTLFKIEGCFGDEEGPGGPGSMRKREGWVLVMPQVDGHAPGSTGAGMNSGAGAVGPAGGPGGLSPAAEMLKWIIALHDAFHLYGRPQAWTWDPRDPTSLMFAYPVGPHKDLLFLDRELAEALDPRDDRTSSIRSGLIAILRGRMGSPPPGSPSPATISGPRTVSPGQGQGPKPPGSTSPKPLSANADQNRDSAPRLPSGPQLPPLSFSQDEDRDQDREREFDRERVLLTPITERSSVYTMQTTLTSGPGTVLGGAVSPVLEADEPNFQSGGNSLNRGVSSGSYFASNSDRTGDSGVPKVPEKDRLSLSGSLSRRGESIGSGDGSIGASPTPKGGPSLGLGKSSFDSFSNAVNTALPATTPVSPLSRTGTVDSTSTSNPSTYSIPNPHSNSSPSLTSSPTTPTYSRSPHLTQQLPLSPSLSEHKTGSPASTQNSFGPQNNKDRSSILSANDKSSILTSPYSVDGHVSSTPGDDYTTWSQFDSITNSNPNTIRRIPTTIQESEIEPNSNPSSNPHSPSASLNAHKENPEGEDDEDDDDDDDDDDADLRNRYEAVAHDAMTRGPSIPNPNASPIQAATWTPVVRKGTPMAFVESGSASGSPVIPPHTSSPLSSPSIPPSSMSRFSNAPGLGRKPSGARAPQRHVNPNIPNPNNFISASAAAASSPPSSDYTQYQQQRSSSSLLQHSQQYPGSTTLEENEEEAENLHPKDVNGEAQQQGQQQPSQRAPQQQQREISSSSSMSTSTSPMASTTGTTNDLNAGDDDVLAVLSYLDVEDHDDNTRPADSASVQPLHLRSANSNPNSNIITNNAASTGPEPETETEPDPYAYQPSPNSLNSFGAARGSSSIQPTYKSSFAPSKQAAERKAKAQAQQAAQAAAAHRPGARVTSGSGPGASSSAVGGPAAGRGTKATTRKMRAVPNANSGAWGESSDEEDDEDEDEDEGDVDSDAEPESRMNSNSRKEDSSRPTSVNNHNSRPGQHSQGSSDSGGMGQGMDGQQFSHLRPPRTLPQIPGRMGEDDYPAPPPRRTPEQYSQAARSTYFDEQPQPQQQRVTPAAGPRQSMWSQVLDPNHTPGNIPDMPSTNPTRSDVFVQLDAPTQMTKAFTPQGLLSAGMAERSDRSAKRQEALARESGASLINVPNKPPPPQTGLLGAITAHERERKREGGVGAALTERERERRVAEERQRRWDEQQRMHMDQMQQGGNPMSMYGAQFPGMNPMMMGMGMGMNPMMTGYGGMNPMMTGMNPMMTGGGLNPMMTGGFPGMMPGMQGGMQGGYNPQHMFAAQHAAQAYQQAMMAFSVAGSQAGGEGGSATGTPGVGSGPTPGVPPTAPGASLNPMMTGGYDPRMSMMSMGGGSPMGMGMGMGGMGMGMGMGMGSGMQTPPQSQFDPRFSPNAGPNATGTPSPMMMNDTGGSAGLLPPGGLGAGGHGSNSRQSNSPVRKGSPLARPGNEAGGSSSRPATPAA